MFQPLPHHEHAAPDTPVRYRPSWITLEKAEPAPRSASHRAGQGRAAFTDAWARYCPTLDSTPTDPETTPETGDVVPIGRGDGWDGYPPRN